MLNELTQIRNDIDRADLLYHTSGKSPLTDHEYDKLKARLRELDPSDDRLTRVGAPIPAGTPLRKLKHPSLMGSLANAMTAEEFNRWAQSVDGHELSAMHKLDGISVRLNYEKGLLTEAATRGDGEEGEDITRNALLFRGVPRQLPDEISMEIRGEAVLYVEDWKALDPDQESNPRNLAAGIARRLDGADAERLTFHPFRMVSDDGHTIAQDYCLMLLESWGFTTSAHVVGNLASVKAFYANTDANRKTLPYWVDGVVVRVNNGHDFDTLGISSSCPRGAIAWKFKAEEKTSTLRAVKLTVGHTGKIIPTADLEPVRIGGTTVSSAHLCNWEEIERLGVQVGDRVVVIKAGDIIPKIIGVDTAARGQTQPIAKPTACPICGGNVGHLTNTDGGDTADLYCLNDGCVAKQVGKIRRWIKSLDIKGLGDEVVEAMMQYQVQDGVSRQQVPMLTSVVDLYKRVTADLLATMQVNGKKFGRSRAEKIMAEIDRTRTLTIDQFLGSLGIKHLGKRRVEIIRKLAAERLGGLGYAPLQHVESWLHHYTVGGSSVHRPLLITFANELGVPGIAADIQADLDAKRPLIEELLEHITIKTEDAPEAPADGPLAGKSFCLTGAMSRGRKEIAADIEKAGGTVKDDVSAGLTALVQADPSSQSSKSKKANKLNIPVISEEQLMAMIGSQHPANDNRPMHYVVEDGDGDGYFLTESPGKKDKVIFKSHDLAEAEHQLSLAIQRS